MTFKKQVSEGTTPVGRTQATKFFVNSSVNALEVGKLLSLNVSQVKGMADRALAFCNTTSTRSFASVVADKCDRGFCVNTCKESAGRSKVLNINTIPPVLNKQVHGNTSFQSHKHGGSAVSGVESQDSTSMGRGRKVHHCLPTIVQKPVTNEQAFKIPCTNHFQLFTDMEPDWTDTQQVLGFDSSRVSGLGNQHGFLSDELDLGRATSVVIMQADCSVNNKAVGSNDREGSNLYGAQQASGADCPEFVKSIQQLGSNFGCIPLTPILVY